MCSALSQAGKQKLTLVHLYGMRAGFLTMKEGLVPDLSIKEAKDIFANYHLKSFVEKGISGFKLDNATAPTSWVAVRIKNGGNHILTFNSIFVWTRVNDFPSQVLELVLYIVTFSYNKSKKTIDLDETTNYTRLNLTIFSFLGLLNQNV